MHQRPPADPDNKDDLLVPADISFATMTMDRNSPAAEFDNFIAPDPVDTGTIYHGDGLADGETAESTGVTDRRIETTVQGRSAVELFDDIFGSSPDEHHQRGPRSPSGAATASSPTIPSSISNNDPSTRHDDHRHPSDMNRLQQEHSTAGYREGLNEGKNSTLQAGFDEGYSLGAAIGGVVGELLGMLEALVVSGEEEGQAAAADTENGDTLTVLLGRARRDLTAPSIFAPDYFATDGTWNYDVEASETAAAIQANTTQAVEAADATFHATIFDVANAHPLVKTWRGIVDRQLERRRIRWGKEGDDAALAKALGLKDEDEGQSEKPAADAAAPTATARAPANNASALDW
ncbi:Essential protein Yae1, N terminal [Sporothrix stenoceras]|uniref:Protein YAE1 n=1 Tax=Sporothrix stenoceras TaxID=5173 RepID=A0ABR3ZKX4_9PEZI